jgi:hypothetical protein
MEKMRAVFGLIAPPFPFHLTPYPTVLRVKRLRKKSLIFYSVSFVRSQKSTFIMWNSPQQASPGVSKTKVFFTFPTTGLAPRWLHFCIATTFHEAAYYSAKPGSNT